VKKEEVNKGEEKEEKLAEEEKKDISFTKSTFTLSEKREKDDKELTKLVLEFRKVGQELIAVFATSFLFFFVFFSVLLWSFSTCYH